MKKQIESVFLALVWYCMVFCGWWIGDGMGNFILPVLHVAERRRLRRSISNLCLRYGATREGNGNVHKVSPNCDSWKISHRMQSAKNYSVVTELEFNRTNRVIYKRI